MVFVHGKQPLTDDQFDHLADQNLSGLEEHYQIAPFSDISSSKGGAGEHFKLEHSKRPLCDGKPSQVALKRPKQLDQNRMLYSFEEFTFTSGAFEGLPASVLVDKYFGSRDNNYFPSFDPPVRAPLFPYYFEDCQRAVGFNQVDEIHSPVLEIHPRKPVAIGPNHQADLPDWKPRGFRNGSGDSFHCDASSLNSETCLASVCHPADDENEDSEKWIRTCVIPMPCADGLASEIRTTNSNIRCSCTEPGSIQCAKQHVMEVRENLKAALGPDRFEALGFCEMGEDVALKWTEEEERLFQEVVLSNPASLGKNFWDELPHVFSSKSSKELVSYYFNVFMLRKRAEQNRSDPMNVDSDNDEWQESDDGEFEEDETEEDSAVDSLTDREDLGYNHKACVGGDIHEESDEGDDCDGEENEGVTGKNLRGRSDDLGVQDESCTSFEGQNNGADSASQADEMQHFSIEENGNHQREHRNDWLSGIADNVFFDGHCDPKMWEMNFSHERREDFLSTCNVVEEVIGIDAYENNAISRHSIS
ncbi:uncharacterized protein LOC109714655 [Ananas comosus]|uniref:Uncharacterized protein LOC109714655 n=2 Tax=Ananas comosus TaxID=4615 RepID=A0A6P5FN88_ANACO|nr:uncharacterized protein LOC109714655 [Ananas comosus]